MTKPEKVEVGQRWDSPFSPKGSTNRVIDRVEGSRVYFDVGSWTTVGELLGDEKGYVYLGGPPATPGAVMEARGDGYPARCLGCGSEKGIAYYTCERCVHGLGAWTWFDFREDWNRGARDFPRRIPESVPQELTGDVGTFSNTLTSKPLTAESVKRAMDAIERLKNKTVFMPKPEFRYGIDYGFTPRIYDPEFGSSPAAPSVSTPVLPRCKWNEPKQEYPGALVYCTGCENPVAHPASPFCESHISQAMDERDHKKREARKEKPFQQSHLLGQGAIGIWSLREEER